jgi:hypothetical protein
MAACRLAAEVGHARRIYKRNAHESGSMPRRRKDGSKIKSRLQLDIPQKLMTSFTLRLL